MASWVIRLRIAAAVFLLAAVISSDLVSNIPGAQWDPPLGLRMGLLAAAVGATLVSVELREATKDSARSSRSFVSFAVVAICLYFPFGWIPLVDNSWRSPWLNWLVGWPFLPGIGPAAYFHLRPDYVALIGMGVTTAALLSGLTWLASRGRYWRLAAAAIALLVSVPSAFISYAAYRS